ncbi:MAG: PAS domain S-box protein, partial [Promethearchaeota archaeon]
EDNVRMRAEGKSSQYELEWTSRNGELISTIVSGAPLIDESGKHRGSFAVITDIRERRELERALEESEANYRSMAEKSLQGITVIQGDRYVFVNKAFGEIVGRTIEEIMGMSSEDQWNMIHPNDRRMLLELAEARREGRPVPTTYGYRFLRKDGSERHVEAFSNIIEYSGEHATQVFLIDITARKHATDELRASQEMLRLVMDNIPAFIFWKNRDSIYIGCNANFARVAGVGNPSEIVGKTDYDLAWKDEESDFFIEVDSRVINSGIPEYNMIHSQLQADGKEAWIESSRVPLYNERGRVIGVLGAFEDITDRIEKEVALRKSEQKYRALAEQTPQGITIMTNDELVYCNRAFSEMVGYTIDELIGTRADKTWGFFHPSDRAILDQRTQALREGKPIPPRYEYRLVRPDGEVTWVEAFSTKVEYGGKPAVQTILIDTTERRRAEREIRSAKDRAMLYLDLLGHDVRNQLQVIVNSASLLRNAPDDETRDSLLRIIESSVSRCSRLIEEVMSTEHLLAVPMTERLLDSALRGVIEALSGRSDNVSFHMSFGAINARIKADEFLELLLSNILMNAVEHNPKEKKQVWITLKEESDGYLLAIGDDGTGISDTRKPELFDVARRFGGLGLHQSSQILEKYEGWVQIHDRVENHPERGAEFRIWFPKLLPNDNGSK